jgi:hypothetical protein
VFALPGSAPSPERRISAALLAIGGEVAACRRSAAYLWGFGDAADVVDVLLPPTRRAPALAGVQALRSRTVVPSDLGTLRGLPVTTPARTLCDLAAVVEDDYALRELVLAALGRTGLDLDELGRRHQALRTTPGASRLARVLERVRSTPPGSDLAREVWLFLRSRGLRPDPQPVWVTCPDGRAHRVDVPFSHLRVGVVVNDGPGGEDLDDAAVALTTAGWLIARIGRHRFRQDRERWLDGLVRLLTYCSSGNSVGTSAARFTSSFDAAT